MCEGCDQRNTALMEGRDEQGAQQAAAQRVERGAEFFDSQNFPKPWYQRIDTDTLSTRDEWKCPAGQLYGHWTNRPDALRGFTDVEHRRIYQTLSFGLQAQPYSDPLHVTWEDLDREWRRVIEEYRARAIEASE